MHWLDLLLFFGLVARLVLSLAAVVHAKAADVARVGPLPLLTENIGQSRLLLRTQPLYWVATVLVFAAELALGIVVLLGGAIVLPLLAPTAAVLDGVARWQFMRDPPPRMRALAGGALATAATAMAARLAPDARTLPLEALWLSVQTLPAQATLGSLAAALVIAEVLAPLLMLSVPAEQALLHAAQAGLFGTASSVLFAALASCVHAEWAQRRHVPFDSPCALELALATLVAAAMQGRRLRRAYHLTVDRALVARVHGGTLIIAAPIVIAVLFAGVADDAVAVGAEGEAYSRGPRGWDPPPLLPYAGFGSRWGEAGFAAAVLTAFGALLLVHRPRGGDFGSAGGGGLTAGAMLGAPRLEVRRSVADLLAASEADGSAGEGSRGLGGSNGHSLAPTTRSAANGLSRRGGGGGDDGGGGLGGKGGGDGGSRKPGA